jgi:hypothetical protein
MATINSGSIKRAGNQAEHQAIRAASGGWVEGLERWGYVARGLLYLIVGGLALQLALGAGGKTADPVGALRYMAQQPYGKVLLVAMVLGLAGYSLWGFVRAFLDPLGKGAGAKGLVARVGYLISALSYGVLIIPAVQLLMGRAAGQQAGSPRGLTAQLMSKPYGIGLVYLFGLFWIVAGAGQLITAYQVSFMRELRTRKMSATERYWAKVIGRVGCTAPRGGLFVARRVLIPRRRHRQSSAGTGH